VKSILFSRMFQLPLRSLVRIGSFIGRQCLAPSAKIPIQPLSSFQFAQRPFSVAPLLRQEEQPAEEEEKKPKREPIPVETSVRYLKSKAYFTTYGEQPVWKNYRRNHKGSIPPRKTRKTCIRGGEISTGNPCPICRDEYLVLDAGNIDLLEQFISPHTGLVFDASVTGLCQKRQTAPRRNQSSQEPRPDHI